LVGLVFLTKQFCFGQKKKEKTLYYEKDNWDLWCYYNVPPDEYHRQYEKDKKTRHYNPIEHDLIRTQSMIEILCLMGEDEATKE